MKKRVEQSLNSFTKDGIAASVTIGMAENFMNPFAIAFGATASEIGFLTSIPNLFSSITQIKVPQILQKVKSRKSLIIPFMALTIFMLVLILISPILSVKYSAKLIIIFFSVCIILKSVASPALLSLIGDLVPREKEGKYFGKRAYLTGVVALASFFIAGFILEIFSDRIFYGFIIIFLIAIIARFVSIYHLGNMYEPGIKLKRKHHFSFFDFIKHSQENNFGKFAVSIGLMDFSMGIASPFFAWYMLKNLEFSYGTYTLILTATTIATLLTVRKWGEYADIYGNIKLVKLSSLLIAFIPLLWIINPNPTYLFIIGLYGGFAIAGYNICIMDFIFDSTTPQKRPICISYTNAIRGIALFLGAAIGSLLIPIIPIIFAYPVLTIFLISGGLRLISSMLIAKIKEVRPVKKTSERTLFLKLSGIGPVYDTINKSVHHIVNHR